MKTENIVMGAVGLLIAGGIVYAICNKTKKVVTPADGAAPKQEPTTKSASADGNEMCASGDRGLKTASTRLNFFQPMGSKKKKGNTDKGDYRDWKGTWRDKDGIPL